MNENANYGMDFAQLPLVNIIVPIYGVEPYLRKCVDSLLAQTYRNIRIILVDDASPDDCPRICDEYASQDDRVVVIHRTNGGLSAARNSGLSFVFNNDYPESDELVCFVDSDDFVTPDYIEYLYKLLSQYNADISQCGHYIVFSETRKIDKDPTHQVMELNTKEALESLCYNGVWDVTAWNKLYRLSIFESLRFPENRLYEDTAISYLVAACANHMVAGMEPKYYYVQRDTSTANSTEWKDYKYQFLDAGDELADWVSSHYPQLIEAANVKRVFVRLSTLSQMVNTNHYDQARIRNMKAVVKTYRKEVLRNPKVAKRDKIGVLVLALGFPFYKITWKAYYKIIRRK